MPLKLVPPRPSKTPYYSVRGTYLGRYVDRSTKTGRKSIALKILARIQRQIESGEFVDGTEMTFAGAALSYMRGGGDKTYLTALIEHFGNTAISQIGQDEIDEAANKLYPGRSPATLNRQVYTPVSAVLRRAGMVIALHRPKGAQGRMIVEWLWPEQANRLFAAAREIDVEFGILLMVLCYTGMRLSEALDGMKIDKLDLDGEDAYAYVPKTKNGEPRPVFLPPHLVAALRAHPRGLNRPGERVFRFSKNGYIYGLLRESAAKAGVRLPERAAFHIFRHTYGTWLRRYAGMDTRGLVGTGAWKDRKSAERYAHVVVTEEAKRAALLPSPELPPLLKEPGKIRGN
jgi:integrase